MLGYIRNIIPFSSVDGPGNRTAIFLQGCNLDCLYCHNPETIEIIMPGTVHPEVKALTPAELLEAIKPYFAFISGLTFSGGECSVQPDFLIECCKLLKEENQHVLIDTNGLMSDQTMEKLLPHVDGFMFDLKASNAKSHQKITGKTNEQILKNMETAAAHGKLYEIRTVILGDWPENLETVRYVSTFIVTKSPSTRYKLIKYRPHGVRVEKASHLESPTAKYMAELFKTAHSMGVKELIIL